MRPIRKAEFVDAVFTAPPSKAHTLRALFISALANGKSTLHNALNGDDQVDATKALEQMGARIVYDGKNFVVEGTDGNPTAPNESIFTGNSGVTTRFVIPMAALAQGNTVIDGSPRMRERPVKDLIESIRLLGVKAEASPQGGLPVMVQGPSFEGGTTVVNGSESSQFLSGILVSAPYAKKDVIASVKGVLRSKPYVDITIECMASFGVKVERNNYDEFQVKAGQSYSGTDYTIEGDYSSASYFFAAAALTQGRVVVENLKKDSLQADKVFLDCLEKIGAKVLFNENSVEVTGKKLAAIEVDLGDAPDIVPTLAVVASVAKGKTIIKNIGHLVHKESNRLEAVASNLKKCGINAIVKNDSLEIEGGNPKGSLIETFDDHRIAMAFSVLGLRTGGMAINKPECVSKSFPGFFQELEKIRGV